MKMKKILISKALIFFVVTFLKGNVLAYNMAEYYPLCQGNEWTYAFKFNDIPMTVKGVVNGTELVNEMDTIKLDFIMAEDSSLVESHNLVMDADALRQYKHVRPTNGTYNVHPSDTPWIMFPNPFDLGDVYQSTYSYSVYSFDDYTLLRTGTGTQTITLESVEDIVVPHGTFNDCLKVFTSVSWEASDGSYGETEETFWYAHKVGPIKTSFTFNIHSSVGDVTINTSNELIDYNVKMPPCCPMTIAPRIRVQRPRHPKEIQR